MALIQFILVYPNGTKKLVAADSANTSYAATQVLTEEEYQEYKQHIKCVDAPPAEVAREEAKQKRLAERRARKANDKKSAKEKKIRAQQANEPAPAFTVKESVKRPFEQVQADNDRRAQSKNGNKRVAGETAPTYTPPASEEERSISSEQQKAIQNAQDRNERENRNAVNRGRTQEHNSSGIEVHYGQGGDKTAKLAKETSKKTVPNIYSGCKTTDDAQKKWTDWAYQQSMEQFCKDKGLTYVQGVTDDLYIEAQKKDPYMFYNGTYYTGTNQNLRDQLIKNEAGLQNFKINQKLSTKITVDPTIVPGIKSAFDHASDNWKPTQKRLADNISSGWVTLRKNSYDEWMRGRKNFVEARKRLQANLDKVNTIGKTLTHNPAKLFEAGIDEYINNHPDSAEAKYFKDKGLTGAQIIDTLTGKYNKDDDCRKDIEKLSGDIDKVQKDPSLSNKYNAEYFNKQIDHINKTYGLSIPPYSASTAAALKSTLEGNKRYQIKKNVKHLATLMMDKQLDSYLDKNIQGVLDKFNARFGTNHQNTPELRDKIRQVIRGTYTVTFNQDELMKDLEQKTEKELERFLENKVEERLYNSGEWKKFMHLDEDAGDIYRKKLGGDKINALGNKISEWTKLNDVDFTLKLTESLTDQLNDKVGFLGSTQNSLNRLDAKMDRFGLGLGLGSQFSALEKSFTLNIASSMEHQLKTSMQGTLKSISRINNTVQNFQKQIQGIQNQARDLVKKWETTAMDMVKAQEKVIVNNIMKSVKIDFKGSIGSFKI